MLIWAANGDDKSEDSYLDNLTYSDPPRSPLSGLVFQLKTFGKILTYYGRQSNEKSSHPLCLFCQRCPWWPNIYSAQINRHSISIWFTREKCCHRTACTLPTASELHVQIWAVKKNYILTIKEFFFRCQPWMHISILACTNIKYRFNTPPYLITFSFSLWKQFPVDFPYTLHAISTYFKN